MNATQSLSSLRVNAARMQDDFTALARIGATTGGGVNRPALSEAHLAARAWFRTRAAECGLTVQVDGAGNHSAVLQEPGAAKTLLLGSHLDSVPQGGRFDGALGVLAALEVLRTVQDAGVQLPVHLEAIDFTDEEGTLVSLLGSAALTGRLTKTALSAPSGGREALTAGLARAGLTREGILGARREPHTLAGYLELHIEQGPRLANAGMQIGIVTGIVGIRWHKLVFTGQANHAGTTPMDARADAGLGASAFLLGARELVLADYPDCVVNVGQMRFEPGAFNVIPGRAQLSLELRAVEEARLDMLERALLAQAQAAGQRFHLECESTPVSRSQPTQLDLQVQAVLRRTATALGLGHAALDSGAGHDAQNLARVTPAGLIFVPSAGGVSHSPREFTAWEDCVNGANVLLGAALELALLQGAAKATRA